MSINGKFELDEVVEEDLFRMSESANISGTMVLKEYQRIKNNLLPMAENVLSENLFPDHFSNAFYEHLKKMHSGLMF